MKIKSRGRFLYKHRIPIYFKQVTQDCADAATDCERVDFYYDDPKQRRNIFQRLFVRGGGRPFLFHIHADLRDNNLTNEWWQNRIEQEMKAIEKTVLVRISDTKFAL